jgi:hypothetical protein
MNPNGIPSFSPGLACHAGIPWVNRQNNPQPQRGCITRARRTIAHDSTISEGVSKFEMRIIEK